jgi:pyruvate carboxylase
VALIIRGNPASLANAFAASKFSIHLDHLDMFGDKVKARTTAIKANLPVIPGTDGPIENISKWSRCGPINVMPSSLQRLANSSFSLKKP